MNIISVLNACQFTTDFYIKHYAIVKYFAPQKCDDQKNTGIYLAMRMSFYFWAPFCNPSDSPKSGSVGYRVIAQYFAHKHKTRPILYSNSRNSCNMSNTNTISNSPHVERWGMTRAQSAITNVPVMSLRYNQIGHPCKSHIYWHGLHDLFLLCY